MIACCVWWLYQMLGVCWGSSFALWGVSRGTLCLTLMRSDVNTERPPYTMHAINCCALVATSLRAAASDVWEPNTLRTDVDASLSKACSGCWSLLSALERVPLVEMTVVLLEAGSATSPPSPPTVLMCPLLLYIAATDAWPYTLVLRAELSK